MEDRAFASREEWETWLDANHVSADGVWVLFPKKSTGLPTVDLVEAIEVALCFGWIDGQRKGLDETHYRQKFTPRRARSKWSQINVGRCEELVAAGRMRAAGHAEIDAAKADGRWDAAYAPPSKIEVPEDLRTAMAAAGVEARFAALKSQERYSILFQIHDAKRPETRARRIAKHVSALADDLEV
ncbi:YdeI/OmpD-associated family protein [Solirubrobacter phytolaccae]|uniref:YdeI/OmpD-associated family protein n=1 Tax=Solirubrobacter phytolaccae TaxID=1404360 RepID=A0A9X3SGG8_9ACTN|nr:YdeI/OmpD-associated family protein [Solirubrobacter phytolaccae]MDA0182432.1 YdeI/OmpD-associated family protein [Solirubrobacter phytolaccae]